MRDDLSRLLFERGGGIYRGRGRPLTESLMGFGFDCGDGWFGLLDALGETLRARQDAIDTECEAVQVKEKFGTLRFYVRGRDAFCSGAIDLAEALSARVCERTGAQGVLYGGAWVQTLSPELADGRKPESMSVFGVDLNRIPATAGASDELRRRWSGSVPGGVLVPDGWADLVDATLCYLSGQRGGEQGFHVTSVGLDDSGALDVTLDERASEADAGALAFARAMAARTDPVTGASGQFLK